MIRRYMFRMRTQVSTLTTMVWLEETLA